MYRPTLQRKPEDPRIIEELVALCTRIFHDNTLRDKLKVLEFQDRDAQRLVDTFQWVWLMTLHLPLP